MRALHADLLQHAGCRRHWFECLRAIQFCTGLTLGLGEGAVEGG